MKIKNFKKLTKTPARQAALEIAEAGLAAIETPVVVQQWVKLDGDVLAIGDNRYDLAKISRIFVVGIGKCSLEAGAELEKILGERLSGGIIVDVHKPKLEIRNYLPAEALAQVGKLEIFTGTHPFPSELNVDITKKIIERLSGLSEKDFVIFIISGGGSTLLCQPKNLTCYNEADLLAVLFQQGATIQEINTIRKHLSLARGGYLAKYLYPAQGIALIFSDVPGNNLEFVASGPTIKDTTTVSDAEKIIKKYCITELCGFKCNLLETPKEEIYFEKIKNILAVSNQVALEAMKTKAVEIGWKAEIITDVLAGEARKVGRQIAADLEKADSKTVLLYAGETTVTLKKVAPAFAFPSPTCASPKAPARREWLRRSIKASAFGRRSRLRPTKSAGKGGRNQELALAALLFLQKGQLVLALASDGRDNSKFAGAISDWETKKKAMALHLKPEDFLTNNNATDFFEKTGDLLMTGDTGSNVSDLIIGLKT